MKIVASLACFLVLAFPASAFQFHFKKPHPIEFVKQHKLLLLTSAIYLASDVADIQTTIHGLQRCPSCTEGSELFGPRPSPARLWGESMAFDVAYVAYDWYGLRKQEPWSAEEKRDHNALYRLCNLEKPATIAVMGAAAAAHAHGAYVNAQMPESPAVKP